MSSSTLCAYIAGLVDGEGYIGIKKRSPSKANRMKTPRYSAAVEIQMTDREPIEVVAAFCGSHTIRRRVRKAGYKPIFCLSLEHEKAVALLQAIQPFLVAKKQRALLVLEAHTLKQEAPKHRTKSAGVHAFKGGVAAGKAYRVFSQSDEFIARLEALYQAVLVGAARSGRGASFKKSSA